MLSTLQSGAGLGGYETRAGVSIAMMECLRGHSLSSLDVRT